MERAFVKVALCHLCRRTVAMKVAEPLASFRVGEVAVCPVADLFVAFEVHIVAGSEIGVQRCDDGFTLWPPELHVLRIVLWRQIATVAKVDYSAKFVVTSPVVRPVEYL